MLKERELPVSYGDLDSPLYENAGFSGPYYVLGSYEAWCWNMPSQVWENPVTSETLLCKQFPLQESYYQARSTASAVSSAPATLGYERIDSSTRKKPLFNSCRHDITSGFNYPYLCSVTRGSSSMNFRYRRMALPYGTTLLSCPEIKQVAWDAFEGTRRRAWWSMQPKFETEIQLLNFIYELKDFKQIAKHLMNFKIMEIGTKLRSLRTKMQHAGNRDLSILARGKSTLAEITKTAAGARLVNEFAIKPLISDLTSIFITLARTIDLAQQAFSDRGKVSQLSHFSELGEAIDDGYHGTRYYTPYFWGTCQVSTFTATMQYKYAYKMRSGWDKLRAGLGLQFTAEAFWNMIPFSFLVDYVYKIGQALHTMRQDPNVNVRLLQYCESIHELASVGVHVDRSVSTLRTFFAPANPYRYHKMVPLTGYAKSLYRRRIVAPNKGAAMPKAKSASQGQLYNLAALIRCFFD